MTRRWWSGPALLACAVLLASCGGGSGGGGGGAVLPVTSGGEGSSGTAAPATATLSGRITFDSVPSLNGALNYAATVAKPVRGAPLDVVDATGTVKASTVTDADGRYSVVIPAATSLAVRVMARLQHSGADGGWDVAVRDNTQSGGLYGMQSGYFAATGSNQAKDLHAPSGWSGSSYGSERVAAPFALLDAIYTAQAKILGVAPGASFPILNVYWSPSNRPASGSVTLGQIGTSHFSDYTASGGTRAIFVLGSENVDTDEYDSAVVVHEWGHYYQSAFSRDDSPGGTHSFGDLLDRRLAFSEGWGNAWSGIALDRSTYSDSAGQRQAQGFAFALDAGAASSPGWFNEMSVQSILWKLNAAVGLAPIHQAMTQGLKSTAAVTSVHAFATAFYAVATPGQTASLNGLLAAQGVVPPMDAFGPNETNDGGLGAFALPLYTAVSLATPQQACVTNRADPGADGNKLGSYAFLVLPVAQARSYTISIQGPAASDPDFVVYQRGKVGEAVNANSGTESGAVGLAAGQAVLAINDYNNASSNTCFTVTIN
ncbi:MAG: hypothetical protein KBC94_25355 [Pseudacidovorax sp.]|nr:hypothetical protein [Pseudacidovorax sp.]